MTQEQFEALKPGDQVVWAGKHFSQYLGMQCTVTENHITWGMVRVNSLAFLSLRITEKDIIPCS